MRVATGANVRTTSAARSSLIKALQVAFSGGSVMGMSVVGLGVLGLSILLFVYTKMFLGDTPDMNVLPGCQFHCVVCSCWGWYLHQSR